MRLPKPVYESLPYIYAGLGAGVLLFSYFRRASGWSEALMACGVLAILYGLVIALKRRDYRDQKRRYGARLDEPD